jgi:hypothetical protein
MLCNFRMSAPARDTTESNPARSASTVPGGKYIYFGSEWVRLPYSMFDRVRKIWHHTDANGLIGVIDHQTVWASSFRSLNDPNEVDYGIDLLERILGDYLKSVDAGAASFLKSTMTNGYQQ